MASCTIISQILHVTGKESILCDGYFTLLTNNKFNTELHAFAGPVPPMRYGELHCVLCVCVCACVCVALSDPIHASPAHNVLHISSQTKIGLITNSSDIHHSTHPIPAFLKATSLSCPC